MAPKKRKSDRGERKKTIIQIEDSIANGNPIVVSFPSGLPESLQTDSAETSLPTFKWQKLHEKSKSGRRVVGQDKHCVYSAYSKGLLYDERRTKLCVGVYDKTTGVVTVREAASRGTVYALEQSVPSYLETNGTVEAQPGKSLTEYSAVVFEDFGSNKKRKVLKSQAANRVEIDNVVGAGEGSAVMNQVMKGESMSESNRKALDNSKGVLVSAVDAALEAARRDFLPTYDINAVKPNKIYSAKEIAGERAWIRVYNKVHACMHKDNPAATMVESIDEKDWHGCTLKQVKEISPESKSAGDRYTCTILLNHLVHFYKSNHFRRNIPPPNETKSSYHGMPVEVASRWISLFTTSFSDGQGKMAHAMSKTNKDKCIIHALLLYMIAQGPSMKIADLKSISSDLKVPINDCANMLKMAGCTVAKKGATYTAVLKTPLTFPPPPRGSGASRVR